MKLREIPRLLSPTRWAVVGVVLLIAVCAILYVLTEPGRARQRAAEARTAGALSHARTESAGEAGRILDQAHGAASAGEQLSRENEHDIQTAPGAGQRLDPGVNDAGRRSLCKRPAYRDRAECVQLLGRAEP